MLNFLTKTWKPEQEKKWDAIFPHQKGQTYHLDKKDN